METSSNLSSSLTILCFNSATAFQPWKQGLIHNGDCARRDASIRPRPFSHGNQSSVLTNNCIVKSFNSATAFQPWKHMIDVGKVNFLKELQFGHGLSAMETNVNPAPCGVALVPLQFGHGLSAMETYD